MTRSTKFTRQRAFKKRHHLRAMYGLSLGEHYKLVVAQGGRCACCFEVKKLVIDHNHATGKVRGLVCQGCNITIGMVESGRAALALTFIQKAG